MTWKHFDTWLLSHNDPTHVLAYLFEVSSQFPKGEINALFRQQLERRVQQLGGTEDQQLIQLHDFDYVGYIARSLRSAGFTDDQIDPQTQDTVVRLLVKPGQLFAGWDGNSPLIARLKTSIKHAIINLVQARQTRRKRIPAMSIHGGGEESAYDLPAPQPESETLIQAFREFLREKHGQAALDVFDERLAGGETKSLIGRQGLETSYRIKQVVQAIKNTAGEFGADDPEFLGMVRRAMEGEAETVSRRFAGKQKPTVVN